MAGDSLRSPSVAVIIPTWNRVDLVRNVLLNLREQTLAPDQVWVIDNGSIDDSAAVARSLGANVLALAENIGFAGAVNQGIEAVSAEWILILNNDVELEPTWLSVAIEAARETGADFVVGKLLQARQPGLLDGSWDLLAASGCAWRAGSNADAGLPLWDRREPAPSAPLTAALFRSPVLESAGLLDTRYESYYEDIDLGLRLRMAGYSGVYEPRARAHHLGSATLGQGNRTSYLISRNQVLLAHKFGLDTQFQFRVFWGQLLFLLTRLRYRAFLSSLRGKRDGLRMKRSFTPIAVDRTQLRAILKEQEQQIQTLQQSLGWDRSWRFYFLLRSL